ncbi:MAG: DUF6449 domain-containing protein [Clostridiales bacterium]|nr:DUF6449 domain-containing protein [Clostridiales bacterium]
MKSGTSSVKLARRLFGRQAWVFALSCVGAFLSWPVLLLFMRSALAGRWTTGSGLSLNAFLSEQLCVAMTGATGALIVLCAEGIGVLSAWSGFSALHSREKTDLLHSLPIRREKLFAIRLGIAAVNLIVPCVVGFLSAIGIAALRGVMTGRYFAVSLHTLGLSLVFGMTVYAVSALAMLLTGQLLVGALGTAVLLGVGPLLAGLFYAFRLSFFDTFRMETPFLKSAGWKMTSPVTASVAALPEGAAPLLAGLAACCALLLLDVAVYRKRPSEAAGSAMAFRLPAAVITGVLTAIGAVGGGLFFYTAQGSASYAWFIFGFVTGLLLIFALVRMIVTQDFAAIFRAWRTLLVAAAAAIAFAAVFRFDLTGFDSRLPSMAEIENIAIRPGFEYENRNSNIPWQTQLANLYLGCDEELYAFLSKMAKGHLHLAEQTDEGFGTVSAPEVLVRVTLKSGKNYLRRYRMRFEDISEDAAKLYARDAYLSLLYPIRDLAPDEIGTANVHSSDEEYRTFVHAEEHDSLVRILQTLAKESAGLTPEEVKSAAPVAILSASLNLSAHGFDSTQAAWYTEEEAEGLFLWSEDLFVWPSFTETITLLEAAGCHIGTNPPAERLRKVTLSERSEEGYGFVSETVIDDPGELAALASRLISWDMITGWTMTDPMWDVRADLLNEDGFLNNVGYRLLKEQ